MLLLRKIIFNYKLIIFNLNLLKIYKCLYAITTMLLFRKIIFNYKLIIFNLNLLKIYKCPNHVPRAMKERKGGKTGESTILPIWKELMAGH